MFRFLILQLPLRQNLLIDLPDGIADESEVNLVSIPHLEQPSNLGAVHASHDPFPSQIAGNRR